VPVADRTGHTAKGESRPTTDLHRRHRTAAPCAELPL